MNFFSFLFKRRFPNADSRASIAAAPITVWKLLAIALAAALIIVVYLLIIKANDRLLVTVPASGGSLTEGIIGAPRAIGPLAAVTNTDTALTDLAYAGLMKENGDGSVIPELAKNYSVSPDSRTYTFTLRDKLLFSDGTPLTSADVAATIEAMQDPVADPRSAAYWQTVSVSAPDPTTVIATIPAPDTAFLQHMTVGVMKASELKREEPAAANTAPAPIPAGFTSVGAGAFKLESVTNDATGTPKKLHFVRNRHYALGAPLLASLDIVVYANQDALLAALSHGDIDVTFALEPQTLAPDKLPGNATFTAIPGTDTVGLWQLPTSELASESLRATLNRFIDKSSIIATIENGYGIPLTPADAAGSANAGSLSLEDAQHALGQSGYAVANGVLSRGGKPVTLSIATLNDPHLLSIAHAVGESFAALGTITQVLSFDQGTLRDDLAQSKLPIVLSDGSVPLPDAYTEAIPLYTEAVVLATGPHAHGIADSTLVSPVLRYANVARWHTNTDRVWKFLAKHKTIE